MKGFNVRGIELMSGVAGMIHHDLSCHCIELLRGIR
jgi:hypothetical protein